MSLLGKTLFITGASRGIGHAIGLRAARDGANIIIASKTAEPHPKLPGTIYTAARDMENAGGRALAVVCDVRIEEQVQAAVGLAIDTFGSIDILINNASAISLTSIEDTQMNRYDLMHSVNARGTFLCSKICLPHLKVANNPHILNISPPLNLNPTWFSGMLAYTSAKYGMSMCTLGMAAELKQHGIAVNSLWPETIIATSAVKNLLGGDAMIKCSRSPEIMADSAYVILNRAANSCSGNFFIDAYVLASEGMIDLSKYSVERDHDLVKDFFLDHPIDQFENCR